MGVSVSTDGELGSNYKRDKRWDKGRGRRCVRERETEELDGKNGAKQRDEAGGEDKGG